MTLFIVPGILLFENLIKEKYIGLSKYIFFSNMSRHKNYIIRIKEKLMRH